MTYSSLDVSRLLNVRTGSFDCEICPNSELQTFDPMLLQSGNSKSAAGPHELHSRLMEQTRLIVELLKKADDITIPAFIPSAWLEKHASRYSMLAEGSEEGGPQLAIAGANSIETKVNVSVELSDEATLRAATGSVSTPLPEWHMYSTITGEAIRVQSGSTTTASAASAKDSGENVIDITTDDQDDIVSYYTQMAEDEPSPKVSKLQETPKEGEAAAAEPLTSSSINPSNPIVLVAGKPVPLDQLTEDDKDKMTEEEYSQYYEIYMSTLQ